MINYIKEAEEFIKKASTKNDWIKECIFIFAQELQYKHGNEGKCQLHFGPGGTSNAQCTCEKESKPKIKKLDLFDEEGNVKFAPFSQIEEVVNRLIDRENSRS